MPGPKSPFKPRLLMGGIPRPHVLRKQLAEATARADQLKKLLKVAVELEAAESKAHARVMETSE